MAREQLCRDIALADLSKIKPLSLQKMARSIARSYGDDGAIILSVGEEGVRIGVEGLTPQQIQDALCLAIHYNYCFSDEKSIS